MFNHLSDAHAAAKMLLAAVLDELVPTLQSGLADPGWLGRYFVPETGLAARIEREDCSKIRLAYGHNPDVLDLGTDGAATDGHTPQCSSGRMGCGCTGRPRILPHV